MAKIIAVSNQKGGVGKTSTATTLASAINIMGLKSLLVDADPQGSASDTYRAEQEGTCTLYDVFKGSLASEAIQKTSLGDIIAGDLLLSNADQEFSSLDGFFILREALQPIINNYDYIIIDTPPALGKMTINALTAATSILITMNADRFSSKGIAQLASTIETAKKHSNPNLAIDGILLTCYDSRKVISRTWKQTIDDMATHLNTKVFNTTIRESVSMPESQTNRESIFTYAPKSTTAIDYRNFIFEYLGIGEKNNG